MLRNIWIYIAFMACFFCGADGVLLFDYVCALTPKIGFGDMHQSQDPGWLVVKKMYDRHISKLQSSSNIRIPQIIHHIRLGGAFPEKLKPLRETWKKYHPDWQLILWTEKEIDEFGLKNKKIYDQAKNYGEKSDIARYEILYRMGGVYVDTDFECLRSFAPMHASLSFYAGVAYDAKMVIFNGLIGSVPGHPILKKCIDSIPLNRSSTVDWEIMNRTGPYFFTRCFLETIHQCDDPVILFPPAYFYPWPYYCVKQSPYDFVEPMSYAIHHWHQSWMT